jgi:hypothetical protein
MDFLWETLWLTYNTIVYLSVILSYTVPSSYYSYPACLLRQLRICACDYSIPRVYTQRCKLLYNQIDYDTLTILFTKYKERIE